ncbi:MAG: cob(I)yrinic acid a,c-diamide adenosyltransferase [Desulfovibrio sp.]|jgi:cob(I)alamin adenosyltransferase|nr:cob(I)yrinic acid a,c-diamide adenosyltransferase [Desulfovibrio sp.]
MILVYTGDGKGKTSAAVGQALRAHGQGLGVAFAQFMKRGGRAGEQKALSELLGTRFFAGGAGFFVKDSGYERHRQAALSVLAWAEERLPDADMLVLDEALYALRSGLLLEEELRGLIAKARARGMYLVLTGRGLPEWLRKEADLITEMIPLKHPLRQGQKALKGIEF